MVLGGGGEDTCLGSDGRGRRLLDGAMRINKQVGHADGLAAGICVTKLPGHAHKPQVCSEMTPISRAWSPQESQRVLGRAIHIPKSVSMVGDPPNSFLISSLRLIISVPD